MFPFIMGIKGNLRVVITSSTFFYCSKIRTQFIIFSVDFSDIKYTQNILRPSPLCTVNSLIFPNGKPASVQRSLPAIPSPLPLATTNLPSISINLPVLDISYSEIICDLLSSITQHNVFKVHPCYSLSQSCYPLYGWTTNILCIHPSIGGHLGCFNFLATVQNAKHTCIVVVGISAFSYSECIPGGVTRVERARRS